MRRELAMAWLPSVLWAFSSVHAEESIRPTPLVEPFLVQGDLTGGEQAISEHLRGHPHDAQARFGLGVVRTLQAIEGLGRSLHRHGARNQQLMIFSVLGGNFAPRGGLPLLHMPVPRNPDPQEISYEQARDILARFGEQLARAEATLAKIESPDVKLPLHFGLIRLDLDDDGSCREAEKLWRVYGTVNRRARTVTREAADGFVVSFDKADVHWLRGYCHLLMAICDVGLAYDWQELFERTGHRLFSKVASPYSPPKATEYDLVGAILDEVAMVHLVRFPVQDAERLRSALHHLEQVIGQSRLTWNAVAAETDDDREWIPGAHQRGVLPGVRVTSEMVDGWHEFLDESEQLLAGEKLIPFWRKTDEPHGVNLQRVFTEPRRLDLLLWLQGTAAVPYLEKGPTTSTDVWNRLQTIFGGQFIGFAVWFN